MSKGGNLLEGTAVQQLLGTDGIEELRSKLIDMIVEEVRDQLHDSSEYIISPDDISSEIFEDMVDEIKDDIKEEYAIKLKEALDAKIGTLNL